MEKIKITLVLESNNPEKLRDYVYEISNIKFKDNNPKDENNYVWIHTITE